WYQKFHRGEFDPKDERACGRSFSIDDGELKASVSTNTTRAIRQRAELSVNSLTVLKHLKDIRRSRKLGKY
ncbi:hypothetical protein Angca_004407, partial [Angiostrongylus cantonensis]